MARLREQDGKQTLSPPRRVAEGKVASPTGSPDGNPKAWDPTERGDEEEEDWDEVIELPVPQAQMKSSFFPRAEAADHQEGCLSLPS